MQSTARPGVADSCNPTWGLNPLVLAPFSQLWTACQSLWTPRYLLRVGSRFFAVLHVVVLWSGRERSGATPVRSNVLQQWRVSSTGWAAQQGRPDQLCSQASSAGVPFCATCCCPCFATAVPWHACCYCPLEAAGGDFLLHAVDAGPKSCHVAERPRAERPCPLPRPVSSGHAPVASQLPLAAPVPGQTNDLWSA